MTRLRNAALGAGFQYAQIAVAMASGFLLFPLVVRHLGAYDNGLWLVSGEIVGYLLLGDLGVFAVLPWLIAARDGAGDHAGIGRHLADSLAVGAIVGFGFIAAAVGVWAVKPEVVGINAGDWLKLRAPLTLMLVMTGVGFPFRAFSALLVGIQDVIVAGVFALIQSTLGIILTATLIPLGYGLDGMALAAGLPPLLTGLLAAGRAFTRHRALMHDWHRPGWAGCRHLVREGFGAWLGGLGTRLLTASNGIIFAGLGRPDWATVYAATGKLAQVAQPICAVPPDSGLVGLSQLHAELDHERTRRIVMAILLLYLLIPGAAAIVAVIVNPWFVPMWVGADFFAGHAVSDLVAANLILGSAVGGLFKIVAVVGHRTQIGSATVAYGAFAAVLGYLLGREHGLPGVVAGLAAASLLAIPYGVYAVRVTFGIGAGNWVGSGVIQWIVVIAPLLGVGGWAGRELANTGAPAVLSAVAGGMAAYLTLIRPIIAQVPWPDQLRVWLSRFRLLPAVPGGRTVVP